MNDCWPCTSWAIVDYFLRPKPSYFTIARELQPFTVGIARKEKKTFENDRTAAYFTIDTYIEIWGTNGTLSDKTVTLELSCFDLHSDWQDVWSKKVVLTQNSSTELHEGKLPGQPTRTKESNVPKTIVTSARILDGQGTVLARCSNWCVLPCYLLSAGGVTVHAGQSHSSSSNFHRSRI
jgi:beta-mannosidase